MRELHRDKKSGILYRSWVLPGSRAAVLLVHGLGAHSNRWEFLAEFLEQRSVTSYAIELKGFGETEGLRGHIDSFETYFQDILTLYDSIRKENPAQKIFIIGESMGGLIAFLLAIRSPELFSGLILISPAFRSGLRFPVAQILGIYVASLRNPKRQFRIPFTSAMCTHDAAYQKIMDEDPREVRVASAQLLMEIVAAQKRAQNLKHDLKVPVLFLVSNVDWLVNPEAARKLFGQLKFKDKDLISYPYMFHSLTVEAGREKVFEDLWGWLSMHL